MSFIVALVVVGGFWDMFVVEVGCALDFMSRCVDVSYGYVILGYLVDVLPL